MKIQIGNYSADRNIDNNLVYIMDDIFNLLVCNGWHGNTIATALREKADEWEESYNTKENEDSGD